MFTVLVVDDDLGIRELLAETIRLMDIFVIEAGDGPTALQRAAEDLPDVILLDVWMPGMDGFEVLTKLRENPATRTIPVVLITAMPVLTWTVKSDSFLEARIKAEETPCLLVVDDDPGVQRLERLVLEEHGYTVLVAGSGEEALDLFDNATPDLGLLDVELGGIDGFTTCQRIRQRSKVPILMATCKDEIWGLEISVDDYLIKPFHPDELVALTKACLRRSTISESVGPPIIAKG